jgi:hypothetical protein
MKMFPPGLRASFTGDWFAVDYEGYNTGDAGGHEVGIKMSLEGFQCVKLSTIVGADILGEGNGIAFLVGILYMGLEGSIGIELLTIIRAFELGSSGSNRNRLGYFFCVSLAGCQNERRTDSGSADYDSGVLQKLPSGDLFGLLFFGHICLNRPPNKLTFWSGKRSFL